MKVLKLSWMGLLALLCVVVFYACKKDSAGSPDVTSAAKKPATGTASCTDYNVSLATSYDAQTVTTTFIWTITNPRPGNGSNNTLQDLSHWSFEAGECFEQYWSAVVEASYRSGESGDFTHINLPAIFGDYVKPDPSQNCSSANVFKFDFGTRGSTPTYYKLVLSGNWGTATSKAIFKSGTNTSCCTKDILSVGCPIDSDCSLSQGYWFAKPQAVWPYDVELGGHTYTQAEGKAIWKFSNKGGINDSKKAFTQVSALILSGADADPGVIADVNIIKNYFTSLPNKISATAPVYMPTGTAASAAAAAAAGRIGNWISANHCEKP